MKEVDPNMLCEIGPVQCLNTFVQIKSLMHIQAKFLTICSAHFSGSLTKSTLGYLEFHFLELMDLLVNVAKFKSQENPKIQLTTHAVIFLYQFA